MGFQEGKIILDSETGAYIPGQTVFGKLLFTQDKVKTFRGIYVQCKGFAHVHWTTTHTRKVNNRNETYSVNHDAHEEYFRTKQYLVGSEKGEHHLQRGIHEFPFQCHIPPHCPSSFEGSHGHIRYKIKIVVDRSFKLDQELKTGFEVVSPLDLNSNPILREPIQFDIINTFCCFCISSGSSQTLVKLPARGFCAGETIPIEVACQNKGSVEIDYVRLQIVKKITFHAHDKPGTKSEEETIMQVKKGPVAPDSSKNWLVDFQIPVMDINNVSSSQIIEVDYHFEVKVSASGCHSDSEDSALITLGTVPFINNTLPPSDQVPSPYPTSPHPNPQVLISQPYPGSPYPMGISPPNSNSPYPPGTSPYPAGNSLYPAGNSPYPPYPAGNSPYPASNSPYPAGNSPYPASNSPNPAVNSPLPAPSVPYFGQNGVSPSCADGNQPSPIGTSPNPGRTSPYPLAPTNSPYPAMIMTPQPPKSPIGFRMTPEIPEAVPLLPYSSEATPPVVSNPTPSAPIIEEQQPYNPRFVESEKK